MEIKINKIYRHINTGSFVRIVDMFEDELIYVSLYDNLLVKSWRGFVCNQKKFSSEFVSYSKVKKKGY